MRSMGRDSKRMMVCMIVALLLFGGTALVDAAVSKGGFVTPMTDPLTWTDATSPYVGDTNDGWLQIDGGTVVLSSAPIVGYEGGTGDVTISGAGSAWKCDNNLTIGYLGSGGIVVSAGAVPTSVGLTLGTSGTGILTISGAGSSWTTNHLSVDGTFSAITLETGGLLNVETSALISAGVIQLRTGGMLGVAGNASDLTGFLDLISGTDNIQYWTGTAWADITGATPGEDYTITYHATGDFAGQTILAVPEPAALSMLALGGMLMLRRRRIRVQ